MECMYTWDSPNKVYMCLFSHLYSEMKEYLILF